MENVLKNNIVLNVSIFIFINVFLIDYYLPLMLCFHILKINEYEHLNTLFFIYIFIVTINRLYLLPLYFNFLFKNTKNQEIKFFIQDLKLSLRKKVILLFCAFLISPILGVIFDIILSSNYSLASISGSFKLGFLFAPFVGLYQAYLILYLYWWLEKIFYFKINK